MAIIECPSLSISCDKDSKDEELQSQYHHEAFATGDEPDDKGDPNNP